MGRGGVTLSLSSSVSTDVACVMYDSYPKIEFYHTDGVRTMMVDILFIYAKLKPETSYRQVLCSLAMFSGCCVAMV